MNGVTVQLLNSSNVVIRTMTTINNPSGGQPDFMPFRIFRMERTEFVGVIMVHGAVTTQRMPDPSS